MQKRLGLRTSHQRLSTYYFTTIILSVNSPCLAWWAWCIKGPQIMLIHLILVTVSLTGTWKSPAFQIFSVRSNCPMAQSCYSTSPPPNRLMARPSNQKLLVPNHILGYWDILRVVREFCCMTSGIFTTDKHIKSIRKPNTLCLSMSPPWLYFQTSSLYLYQLWMQLDCSLVEATAAGSCQNGIEIAYILKSWYLQYLYIYVSLEYCLACTSASSLEGLLLQTNNPFMLLTSFNRLLSFHPESSRSKCIDTVSHLFGVSCAGASVGSSPTLPVEANIPNESYEDMGTDIY